MRTERVNFAGGQGTALVGRLDLPDTGAPKAYAVFSHCFGCTKNIKIIGYLDRALTDAGIAVLRFDFTGLGESEGDFADTNFTSNVLDIAAAARMLEAQYEAPRLLIGHSLGGAASLMAARHIPSVAAIVTIASPASLGHLEKIILTKAPAIERTGEAEVELMGRRFHLKKQFLDDLRDQSMSRILAALRLPLLVMHAPEDSVVPIAAAERIFNLASHPKSLVALDRADHLMLDEEDARYAGGMIAAWFARYL
jgi:pimeloyl-ACP methyl ester carboxylesterase